MRLENLVDAVRSTEKPAFHLLFSWTVRITGFPPSPMGGDVVLFIL